MGGRLERADPVARSAGLRCLPGSASICSDEVTVVLLLNLVLGTLAAVAFVAIRLARPRDASPQVRGSPQFPGGPPGPRGLRRLLGSVQPLPDDDAEPNRIQLRVLSQVGLGVSILFVPTELGLLIYALVEFPGAGEHPIVMGVAFVVLFVLLAAITVPLVIGMSTGGWLSLDSRSLVLRTTERTDVIELHRDFNLFLTSLYITTPYGPPRTDVIVSVSQMNPQSEVNITFRYPHVHGTPCPPSQGPVFHRQVRVGGKARVIQEQLRRMAGG